MSTTADKLNYLDDTKSAIREAIENKGVSVSNSDTFRSYAEKIDSIDLKTCLTGIDDPSSVYIDSVEDLPKRLVKEIDLSKTNLRLADVSNMFNGYSYLTSIIWPEDFDTTDFTSLKNMFLGCKELTVLDLSFFNTSNVTDMNATFSNCGKLTTLDISSWDTSKVTTTLVMFIFCESLVNVTWGNNWMSTSSTNSFNISSCPVSHTSCLDLFNKLAVKERGTLTLSDTTKSYMSEEEIAIATGKGWTVA